MEGTGNAEVAEAEHGVGPARPRRGAKGMPGGMRVVRRSISEKGERRAERLDSSAELEAREPDLHYLSRMEAVKKFGKKRAEQEIVGL